jgi:hypothetical protein
MRLWLMIASIETLEKTMWNHPGSDSAVFCNFATILFINLFRFAN